MTTSISRRTVLAGGLTAAAALTLAACGKSSSGVDGIKVSGDTATITVGATPQPHVTILQWIQDNLAADAGLSLEIKEINDYQTPNSSLNDGALAANFYQTPNFLAQQMQEKGYLPLIHFDKDKSTIILTDQAYQQYLDWEKENEVKRAQEASMSPAEREVLALTREGEKYIRNVRQANDRISDHAMTSKLDRLEKIMQNIFENVKKHPESARDIRRMIDFYLPTIQKLLNAYIELDSQPDQLENVKRTKLQIEESMDTINDAFEKLLNDLFQNVLFDVSSDISVMETMMKQDGLSGQSIRDYESGLQFGTGAGATASGSARASEGEPAERS